ncbi:COP9 signalosome [Mycotypha africana]|uniref:COP9 signalosome n=1 Tax=Mycotypha africana TaxID=64632 RepID=UPI002300DBDB|nr:COP9 signalosome [Mycotypha africana]KAI8968035.1 COP9 signalosome [Mycotypha africana]
MNDLAMLITQNDFLALLERCEQLEIQAVTDANIDLSQVYPVYLASCLLTGDLQTARHVRKRSLNAKIQTAQIDAIWRVVVDFITKDYAKIYQDLDGFQWNDYMQLATHKIKINLREYMVQLVSKVYSSIEVKQAACYFGVSENEAIQELTQRHWKYEEATQTLYPNKQKASVSSNYKNSNQFSRLADIVLSLEKF